MTVKDQLITEINRLDERYLELLYKIICQFPHGCNINQKVEQGQQIIAIFQEIADAGGLGISDPQEWQKEIRKDRSLPFRGA